MKNPGQVWVIIHMAHGEERARVVFELLTHEGFMVKTRPVAKALSPSVQCFEVLALTSEAQEARDFLRESGY